MKNTLDLIKEVNTRTLPGMAFEGVVCKQNRSKTHHPPKMLKIKSFEWIDKVKSLYTDPKVLEQLL